MKSRNLMRIGLIAAALAGGNSANATENGLSSYPIGVNTAVNGALPQPGDTWLQDYTVYLSDGAFNNGSGHSMVPGFHSDVGVNAARLLHTWDVKFGPFALASGIAVRGIYTDVGNAFTGNSHQGGMGDSLFEPLYLGWSNADHTLSAYGGVAFTVPSYTNVSTNYYSVQPIMNLSWMPTHDWDFGVTGLAEFHSPDDKTSYHSGTLLIADWDVLYRAFPSMPQLKVGLNGYVVKQVSNDTLRGKIVEDGFKQEGFAIGPQLSYAFKPGLGIVVKWQHDVVAKYRAKGDSVWFEFNIPLGTGHKPGDPT